MPLGYNQWHAVAVEYNTYATENGCAHRNADALKIKFEKFAATEKLTGKKLLVKCLVWKMLEVLEVPKKRIIILVMNLILVLLEWAERPPNDSLFNGASSPSAESGKRLHRNTIDTRSKRKETGEMHETVAGYVQSLPSIVDKLLQVITNNGGGTEDISSLKEELSATITSIDALKLIVISALNNEVYFAERALIYPISFFSFKECLT